MPHLRAPLPLFVRVTIATACLALTGLACTRGDSSGDAVAASGQVAGDSGPSSAASSSGGAASAASSGPTGGETRGVPPTGAPAGQAPAAASASATDIRALQGTIGKDSRFRMFLRRDGGMVGGFYLYDKYGLPITLKGTSAADGRLHFDELDGKGRKTGTFDVALTENGLEGTWTGGKGNRTLAVTAGPNHPFPNDLPALTGGFKGSLGGKIRFLAQLDGGSGKLEGFYRYPKSTEDLQLSGTLAADGAFALEERDARGKVTGRWRGFFLTSLIGAGDWEKADGSKRLPLALQLGGSIQKIVDLGSGMKLIPKDGYYEAKLCELDVSWPQLSGHPDRAAQEVLNRTWARPAPKAGDCMELEPDQTWTYYTSSGFSVSGVRDGFLGLEFSTSEYSGGAHPNWNSQCRIYHLASGTELELAPLLKPDGLKKLSALVDRNFKKEHGVTDLSEAGFSNATIELSAMPSLCLEPKGFRVQFSPYEIAVYAAGGPSTELTAAEAGSAFVSNERTRALFGGGR